MSFLVGAVRAFVLLPPCLLGIRVSTSACVRAAETRPMISGYPGSLFTTGVPAVFAAIMAAMYARGEDEVAAADSAGCAKHFVGRMKTMRLLVMTQGTLMEAPNESGKSDEAEDLKPKRNKRSSASSMDPPGVGSATTTNTRAPQKSLKFA